MDILELVSRDEMADAMGVSIRQTYKAQKSDLERYKLIAYGVYARSVNLDELQLAIETVRRLAKLHEINKIKETL